MAGEGPCIIKRCENPAIELKLTLSMVHFHETHPLLKVVLIHESGILDAPNRNGS
jgi:hypothetical protein